MDDWELNDTVQLKVEQLMTRMNASNFKEMGDYEGYKSDFLKLNGFGFDSVDYHADVDLSVYEK
jgi:enoyl-[acyl-carrier protein] reductase/trans-2-enoyl-CoA reductase (NAD+)